MPALACLHMLAYACMLVTGATPSHHLGTTCCPLLLSDGRVRTCSACHAAQSPGSILTLWEKGHIVDKGRGRGDEAAGRGMFDPILSEFKVPPTPAAARSGAKERPKRCVTGMSLAGVCHLHLPLVPLSCCWAQRWALLGLYKKTQSHACTYCDVMGCHLLALPEKNSPSSAYARMYATWPDLATTALAAPTPACMPPGLTWQQQP